MAVVIDIRYEQDMNGNVIPRRIETATRDISPGGFGFVCEDPIALGTTLHAVFEGLAGQPVLVGAVRNCQHLGGRQHRIGVEFIEKAAAEAEAEDAA